MYQCNRQLECNSNKRRSPVSETYFTVKETEQNSS